MSINVYSLGSGSKGNCVVLADGKNNIMIDAGLYPTATYRKLAEIGLGIGDLSGILLTHEHSDHIKSLSVLAEVLPVYTHADTINALADSMENLPLDSFHPVGEEPFTVGGYEVTAFSVSHDAAHPLGFTVSNGNEKVGYVTDTGFISRGVKKAVSGCDVIVAESNHDKELLLRGSYPERLKRRILSDKGHLCNDESALFCRDLAENGAKRIMLAHISENNNLAELAYWTAYHSLAACGAEKCDVTLRVALQRETVII